MTQKRQIQVVLLILLISGLGIYLANREPTYNGRTLSSWLKELNADDDDHSQAREAIRHISADGLPYILDELRLKDSNGKRKLMEWNDRLESRFEHDLLKLTPAEIRRTAALEAINALGTNAIPAIPEISQNLADREIAFESALALGMIGEPAFATIQQQSHSTNPDVRWACAFALRQFTNGTSAVPTLQKLAGDTQPDVRSMAAQGLGLLAAAPDTSVPILLNLLSDTNTDVQLAACRGLCGFGTNGAIAAPALSNLLASPGLGSSRLQNTASLALRRIGPSSIPIFLQLLSHPDSQVRSLAVRRLSTFQNEAPSYVSKLLPMLRDPDRRVRMYTLISLRAIRIAPDQLMPSMIEAFKFEPDPANRDYYKSTFEQFGQAATNAVPTLAELATSAQGESRTDLLLAIAAIDEEAAKRLGADADMIEMARANRKLRLEAINPSGIPPPPISAPHPSP